MGLPEFQPPEPHMRSYSMVSPMRSRLSAAEGIICAGIIRKKIMACDVGSTQLAVPTVQLQPK
jgi:hypothetical protein